MNFELLRDPPRTSACFAFSCRSRIEPTQLYKISGFESGYLGANFSGFGANRRPIVRWQNKDCELSSNHLLLVFQVLVRRDERVELNLSLLKQGAILQLAPAHFLRGVDTVVGQELAQWTRHAS